MLGRASIDDSWSHNLSFFFTHTDADFPISGPASAWAPKPGIPRQYSLNYRVVSYLCYYNCSENSFSIDDIIHQLQDDIIIGDFLSITSLSL